MFDTGRWDLVRSIYPYLAKLPALQAVDGSLVRKPRSPCLTFRQPSVPPPSLPPARQRQHVVPRTPRAQTRLTHDQIYRGRLAGSKPSSRARDMIPSYGISAAWHYRGRGRPFQRSNIPTNRPKATKGKCVLSILHKHLPSLSKQHRR